MARRQEANDEGLRAAQVVAETTCILLRGIQLPSDELPGIMQALHEIATGEPRPRDVRPISIMPAVIAAIQDADKPAQAAGPRSKPQRPRASRPQRWTSVAPTNVPVTPIQKLEAALRRSPIRLDDRTAMAIARASGKAIGRDKLEQARQVDDRMELTFGFDFGSAKFTAKFDIRGNLGNEAVAALMEMLDARG